LSRPERAYSAQVVRYWPDLSVTDPDMHWRLTKADTDVSTNMDVLTGELRTHRQREVKPRLRITCHPDRHRGSLRPTPSLAEVWDTRWGVLFVAALGGAAGDPPDTPDDPFAPPLVLLRRIVAGSSLSVPIAVPESWTGADSTLSTRPMQIDVFSGTPRRQAS
jgi:hypothetical protein